MTPEIVQVQAVQPSAEESAAALAAAAATAPTNEAEARAQIAAEEAAKNGTAKPVRPDNVPEKFWDAEKGVVNHEALLASYSELEKKVGAPKEEPKPGEEKKPDAEQRPEGEEAPKGAAETIAELNKRFETNGQKLTEADYELAQKSGYDKATVDSYIAGQQALAELATQRITSAAGGKDSMDRMFAWASTSLSADEIGTFNKSFEGADVNAAVMAMETLKGKYEAANGKDPKLVGGKPAGAATDVFTSWAQVSQAMSDPRYGTDHAYRTSVEQKLGRSDNIR